MDKNKDSSKNSLKISKSKSFPIVAIGVGKIPRKSSEDSRQKHAGMTHLIYFFPFCNSLL
jgi:hypothetical protein